MADPNLLEEDLNKIEIGIRQLKLQYDMFFSGVIPRQPFEVRKELEILIKTLGNTPMQRFADRYRYNSLAAKYQTMVELWNKMIRAKEEGRLRPGIPGFVEPVRRTPAAEGPGGAPRGRAAVAARAGGRTGAQPGSKPGSRQARQTSEFYRSQFTNPSAEDESFRVFYDRFIEANRLSGDDGKSRVSYGNFLKQIEAKTRAIKQKAGCDAVTYSIVMKKDGVSLKAVPAGRGGRKGDGK